MFTKPISQNNSYTIILLSQNIFIQSIFLNTAMSWKDIY